MTDEQINKWIAESCGWTPDKRGLGWLSPHGYYAPEPNYCNDLNAMHEAEKMHRMGTDWDEYALLLGALCGNPIYATARQRAEAFLRTLGKWEETTDKDSLTVGAITEDSSVDHFRDVTKKIEEVQE